MSFVIGFAQISFTDGTGRLAEPQTRSGSPMAIHDMNGDFLDDIVRLGSTFGLGNRDLTIEYQSLDGSFTSFKMVDVINKPWAMCIADVDNDGLSEILTGGYYDSLSFFRPTDNGAYIKTSLDGSSLFVQGMSFTDINNDGFVEAFLCHDEGANQIWGNNGSGQLAFSGTDFIDLNKYPTPEDNSGNYGGVWTDFDLDGDLDLYVAKCREDVDDPTDIRRINQLWVNDGENNFVENAVAYGLDIGSQSWTSEFQDIDNDGDFDAFISNHDSPSQILENVGNQFIDITAMSGVDLSGFPIQAAMKDFDNDGFVDILVTGHLFHNNGDKTFTKITPNPMGEVHSFALGDLNHDGFIDICAGYGFGVNEIGETYDVLWLNEGNENNWIAVNLIGRQSNRGGIGAKIEVKGSFGTLIREVRAGESYGIVNTLTQHFGIGTVDKIETVTIKWPSGKIDILENPGINEFLTVEENGCVSLLTEVQLNGETTFCSGDSLDIMAPSGFKYLWSTDDTTQSITVKEEGKYAVTISDGTGCFGISQIVSVVVDPDEFMGIAASDDIVFCQGGSVELVASESSNYLWSTGETSPSIVVTDAGAYSVSREGTCNTVHSEVLTIDILNADEIPTGTGIVIDEPGSAVLEVTGDNPRWYAQETGGDILWEGNTFMTPFLEETTVFYVESTNYYGGGVINGGPSEHTGTSNYTGNHINGSVVFDCHESFVLQSVLVYTDVEGERIIELVNADGEVLDSQAVILEIGENVISLNFMIDPAQGLALTTNLESNLENFGFKSPRLRRTTTNGGGIVDYPYDISTVASMYGKNFYYFFYDWQVEILPTVCVSPRIPVEAIVETAVTVGVNSVDGEGAIKVFPNPTLKNLNIEIQSDNFFMYQLMDMKGGIALCGQINSTLTSRTMKLDVSMLPKGMYSIQFIGDSKVYANTISIL